VKSENKLSSSLPYYLFSDMMEDSPSAFNIVPVGDVTVPYLQDLCFNAFYRELVCKASPGTVTFVRQCIHQQLMGSMRKKIRFK